MFHVITNDPISHDVIRLFIAVLDALRCLPAGEFIVQERAFHKEFDAAFGLEWQANVCRDWLARLARDKQPGEEHSPLPTEKNETGRNDLT